MNRSKQKGTAAETAVARFLQKWWPSVERRTLTGSADKGDIAGLTGVVVEVKNQKTINLAAWCDELTAEMINANCPVGFLVVKRRGTTDPAQWYWVTDGNTAVKLLREWGA